MGTAEENERTSRGGSRTSWRARIDSGNEQQIRKNNKKKTLGNIELADEPAGTSDDEIEKYNQKIANEQERQHEPIMNKQK